MVTSSSPLDPYWLVRYSLPGTTFSKVQLKLSFEGTTKTKQKNAANGQQSALSYVYDIRPKMVNAVKNSQKQLNTVK